MFHCFTGGEKKRTILEAFMKLASENPNLNDISVKMIADEAGIGKSTVYEYYSSKDEIIQEAVSLIINAMFEWYLVDNYEALDYSNSLKQFIENCYEAAKKVGEYSRYNSFTIRETFKFVDSKEFLFNKIRSLVLQVIELFMRNVIAKGVEEGIIDADHDKVIAGMIAKTIIRDVTENAEFKFLAEEEIKEKLYTIAYKQMKVER
jgi:AcrR family transcriptional regulator